MGIFFSVVGGAGEGGVEQENLPGVNICTVLPGGYHCKPEFVRLAILLLKTGVQSY
jgi:hypothetical protein